MHEAKSLSVHLERENINSGYVATGLREVRNEAECDRIFTHTEYNRNRCGCSFCGNGGWTTSKQSKEHLWMGRRPLSAKARLTETSVTSVEGRKKCIGF